MTSNIPNHIDGNKPSCSITVDHRTSHSLPSSAIQSALKPFGDLILKPGDPLPPGSPQLKPHHSIHSSRKCTITESVVESTYVYTFSIPAQGDENLAASEKVKRKLYYFAGGGFRGEPTKEHWSLCAEMCMQLPSYSINLVSYPLVPNSPASHSIPHLERFYQKIAREAKSENWFLTLMGDSAGGNIVLVLGIYAARRWLEEKGNGGGGDCVVRNIFAICPATDLRHQHPEIDDKETKDPVLTRKIIEEVADAWKGDWELSDPRISPVLADLTVLKTAGIKVDGVLGGYDCLAPEGAQFKDKLAEVGITGEWLEWERQMHCFVLMFSYHFAEPAAAKDWILDVLRRNVELV